MIITELRKLAASWALRFVQMLWPDSDRRVHDLVGETARAMSLSYQPRTKR